MRPCWCGNRRVSEFGPDYAVCSACGTLVSQRGLSPEQLQVKDDEQDFYGKRYWCQHQSEDLSFPDIHQRARKDLTERNAHWLRTLLRYRLPPAEVLELGCAHGSFVALCQLAGFRATGMEMSPWVVDYGRKTFGIPVLTGPVEATERPAGALDVVALMDVLEHLPDPLGTMRHCLRLLKPGGMLLIQTPNFREDQSYEALVEAKDPFLDQLKSDEHLFLFSRRSVVALFNELGAPYIECEPAIFAQYDMFLAVSGSPLQKHETSEVEAALLASPLGRMALAILDLRQRETDLLDRIAVADADRNARGEQVRILTAHIHDIEHDRSALRAQLDALNALLRESETDRSARQEQIETLTALLRASEADRAARGQQIETLTAMALECEADRAARWRQIEVLTERCRRLEEAAAARAGTETPEPAGGQDQRSGS